MTEIVNQPEFKAVRSSLPKPSEETHESVVRNYRRTGEEKKQRAADFHPLPFGFAPDRALARSY